MSSVTRPRTAFVTGAALLALLGLGVAELAEAKGRHGGHGHGYRGHPGHGGHWAGHRGGHRHHGRWRSGVSIGIGVGVGGYYPDAPWWGGYPAYPGYGVVLPPRVVYLDRPAALPPEPLAKGPPDPIFYPRQGQSAAQTEADLQACHRWALGQPDATARADVFHRATLACMEGRDYTVR